jgi:hypothetical protein
VLGQSSTEPAWKTIPSWDVIGRQDKIIPEAAQLMMAHRAGSHITEIDSSHVSLISHPAEAAVILKAAYELPVFRFPHRPVFATTATYLTWP